MDPDPRTPADAVDEPADAMTVARGTRHTATSQVLTQAVRFATNIVLARLLTPDDFGVVAIALVVSLILDQLKDLGTGAALIQRQSVDRVLLNSVFYLNLALGFVLAIGMYVSAGPVAGLLGNPRAEPVLQVFAAITLLTSIGQIHHSLLRRDLRFFEIAIVTTTSSVVTAAVSIGAALFGLEFWALVLGTATGSIVGTVMVWVYDPWRPSLQLSVKSLGSIWGYSRNLFMSNILFLFFTQVDKIIVSHFLGSAALGTYTLAQRTVTSPVTSVGSVVTEVAFPAFSRLQDDHAALRSGFLRSARVVALLTFPAMIGLAVLAEPTVQIVFGSRWSGLVPIIWMLAPVAAIQSVSSHSSQLLLAKGRSDWSYRWGIVYCVILTGFELIGVHWGLVGVAGAYAAGIVVLTPFGLLIAFSTIQLRLRDYLRELLPHALMTAVMTVCVYAAARAVRLAVDSAWLELTTGVIVGGAVYLVLLRRFRPQALDDAFIVIRERSAK